MMNRREAEQLNTSASSGDFTLDEIVREFGSSSDTAPPVEQAAEEETVKVYQPRKPQKKLSDDTLVFSPVHAPQEEPDLEAPMKIADGGKLPAAKLPKKKNRPLVRSRVQKERKLIEEIKQNAPPSAREQLERCRGGLGLRHLRILLLTLPVLANLFLLLYRERGWAFLPIVSTLGTALPLCLLLLSCALAYDVFLAALHDVLRLRIGTDTLTCVAVCLAAYLGVARWGTDSQTYCAAASFLLLAQLRGLHSQRVSRFYTLRTVCLFDTPMGIFDAPKLLKDSDSLFRDRGDLPDFLEKLGQKNRPLRVVRIYSTVLFFLIPSLAYLFSVAVGVGAVEGALLLLLCAVPFGMALTYVHPFASIAKRLASYKGALCGWHGAKLFGGKHTIILSDEDLFPKKNITSNGMKLYGSHKAPRIIASALAGLRIVDSPLVDLFESLLQAQYGKHLPVSQHRIYDDGGIGMEIVGDVVLVGSLSFMRSMGVHMPAGTRVRQAVYVSVNGELAGIFALKYKPGASTRAGLRDVLDNRNFSVVLATRDFLISPELIAAKYALPTDSLRFPDYSERLKLSELSPEQSQRQGALIAKDSFGSFAVTVAAGRTLRLSTLICLALNLFAGVLGLLLCAVLLAWNSVSVLSPFHIAAFQLLWAFLNSFVSFVILKV